jgi:hypothetical protein
VTVDLAKMGDTFSLTGTSGFKLQVGTGHRGAVHMMRATDGSVAYITQPPELLHGQEWQLFGDQAYRKKNDRNFLVAWGARHRVRRALSLSSP